MVKGIYSIVLISLLYVVGVQSQACSQCQPATDTEKIKAFVNTTTGGCKMVTYTCIPKAQCNGSATIWNAARTTVLYKTDYSVGNTQASLICAQVSSTQVDWMYNGVAAIFKCEQLCQDDEGTGGGGFTFIPDTTESTTVPATSTETTTPCVESTTTSSPSTSQPVRGCRVQKKK